jgi:hypothetical protein
MMLLPSDYFPCARQIIQFMAWDEDFPARANTIAACGDLIQVEEIP